LGHKKARNAQSSFVILCLFAGLLPSFIRFSCLQRKISRMLVRPLLVTVLLGGSLHAQSVSQELKDRTGHALRDAGKEPSLTFLLPPGVDLTDKISSSDAVAIALWNNAALQADLANLEVSRADLLEAGVFRNPSFSMLLPVGPKLFEFLLAWPIEEFWQRKQRVKTARANLNAVAAGLVQNGLNLVRDVRLAHTDLWLAEERTETLRQSAELRERIATLTERRRSNGDATSLDVSLARADAQSARELANRAAADTEVVRSRLRHLFGLPRIARTFSAVIDESDRPVPALTALLDLAIINRPDLRAAELEIETTAQRAKWQRSRVLAMVAPALSVKGVGTAGIRTGPGLNADIPILSRNQGQISRADGEVLRAGRLYESAKDRVEQEVVESYEKVIQAQSSLAELRERVFPAVNESVRLIERAFQNGDVSFLDVLEVTRQRYDVALREIEARGALLSAFAQLERAIGRSL
jgi:outer membrane protein, heavy metal efflux system